jgi:FKBP-type peptidyl-prolyl cis-trans isomerase FklB
MNRTRPSVRSLSPEAEISLALAEITLLVSLNSRAVSSARTHKNAMKSITTAALALSLIACTATAADTKMTLKDDKDKISYSIGLNIGRSMKSEGLPINPDALAAAMKDVFSGAKPLLTDEEVKVVMENFQKEMQAKQLKSREEGLGKNKAEGEKFLADNKKKAGVKSTASGLQYTVIKDGTGKTPKATDTVSTHYRGTLINGTEFDSSYKRGEPAEFPVNGVIKGWTEALQLMKEGSKWQLYIPSDLAYGERGAGKDIGPNSTLIFEIELLKVKAAQ